MDERSNTADNRRKAGGKPFVKGDPRINRKGRPKTFDAFRELAQAISHSSNPGQVVFDGFLGSGTTLIACERLGRKCRAVEISPAYCAVAIQRWVDVTGGTPELLE